MVKRLQRLLFAAQFSFVVFAQAMAAQPTAAAPVQAGQGPSLRQTYVFIQNLLAKNGKVAWLEEFSTDATRSVTGWSEEVTSAHEGMGSFEEAYCTLHYHLLWTKDGGDSRFGGPPVLYGDDFVFHFKDVKAIQVTSGASRGGSGVFAVSASTSPAIISVVLDGPAWREGLGDQHFTFTDPAKAGQLARAMAHAVALCGGSAEIGVANTNLENPAIQSPPPLSGNNLARPLEESMSRMQAILEHLGKQGHIGVAAHGAYPGWSPRSPDDLTFDETEIRAVSMHPQACGMEYQKHSSVDRGTGKSETVRFSLRDIENVTLDEDQVDVRYLGLVQQKLKMGHPPPYSPAAVNVTLPQVDPERNIPVGDHVETIRFPDKSSADTFRSIFIQVSEICRGRKDLF